MIKNYQDKPLTEYTSDNTVYMRKYLNGRPVHVLVQFVKFINGTVHGIILGVEEAEFANAFVIGNTISAKATKCFSVYNNDAFCFFGAKGEMVSRCKEH